MATEEQGIDQLKKQCLEKKEDLTKRLNLLVKNVNGMLQDHVSQLSKKYDKLYRNYSTQLDMMKRKGATPPSKDPFASYENFQDGLELVEYSPPHSPPPSH